MRFTVSSNLLNQRLQNIRGVISGKNSLLILDCFLFEFNGKVLTITAADCDNRIITTLEVNEIDVDAARICINAKTILDTLKELSDQPLTFEVDIERNTVNGKYSNGEFNITCQPANDYPMAATVEGERQVLTMPCGALLNGINRCASCTKEDEIRPVMNGIFIDAKLAQTTFVATDGHKLMRSTTPKAHTEAEHSVILHKKVAALLRSILTKDEGEVTISTTGKVVEVRTADYFLTGKLIEGRYPNYNAVIPNDNPYKIVIDRQSLLSAAKRVSLFSSQSSSLVKLRFEAGMCTLTGQDYEFAKSAEEHIICQYDGPNAMIGFKGNLLIEMLSLADSQEVRIEIADPSKPGLIIPLDVPNDEQVLMLLMPMMVKD
ncbi:MAG: DNA polymerase III subunit beta [Bacteroidaceae bacterium]|nr:DNA polymerase III subunit beta [Bacteroidaceae bacterium]